MCSVVSTTGNYVSKDIAYTTVIQVAHYLQWVKHIYPTKTISNQIQRQIEQAELQEEIQSSKPNVVTWCLKLQAAELTKNRL